MFLKTVLIEGILKKMVYNFYSRQKNVNCGEKGIIEICQNEVKTFTKEKMEDGRGESRLMVLRKRNQSTGIVIEK